YLRACCEIPDTRIVIVAAGQITPIWADIQLIEWRISGHALHLMSGCEVPNARGVVNATADQVLAIRCEAKVAGSRIVHDLHGHAAAGDVPHLHTTLQARRCQ